MKKIIVESYISIGETPSFNIKSKRAIKDSDDFHPPYLLLTCRDIGNYEDKNGDMQSTEDKYLLSINGETIENVRILQNLLVKYDYTKVPLQLKGTKFVNSTVWANGKAVDKERNKFESTAVLSVEALITQLKK